MLNFEKQDLLVVFTKLVCCFSFITIFSHDFFNLKEVSSLKRRIINLWFVGPVMIRFGILSQFNMTYLKIGMFVVASSKREIPLHSQRRILDKVKI